MTGKEDIEVRPKLKAGSNEEEDVITIIGQNMSGFPSTKDNTHKLEEVDKLLQGRDGAVILETGVNED